MNNNTQFKKWTKDEESQLLTLIASGKSLKNIAKLHDRSENAIRLRLLSIAIDMQKSGASYNDIFKRTACTESDVIRRIGEIENEKHQKYSPPMAGTFQKNDFGMSSSISDAVTLGTSIKTAIENLKDTIGSLRDEIILLRDQIKNNKIG